MRLLEFFCVESQASGSPLRMPSSQNITVAINDWGTIEYDYAAGGRAENMGLTLTDDEITGPADAVQQFITQYGMTTMGEPT